MHKTAPRIQAIAPGSDVVLVVMFALQCGQVIDIEEGPSLGEVTTTTCAGRAPVTGAVVIEANPPALPK